MRLSVDTKSAGQWIDGLEASKGAQTYSVPEYKVIIKRHIYHGLDLAQVLIDRGRHFALPLAFDLEIL